MEDTASNEDIVDNTKRGLRSIFEYFISAMGIHGSGNLIAKI